MSMYRGHLVGGLVAYLLVIAVCSIWRHGFVHDVGGLIATLAGSLFPDIDVRSTGQSLFLKVLLLVIVLCIFLQASLPLILLLIFSVLPLIFPHRGLFHDLLFILALTAVFAGSLIYTVPSSSRTIITMALFFLAGVLSHLILDKGTKKTFYRD